MIFKTDYSQIKEFYICPLLKFKAYKVVSACISLENLDKKTQCSF